MVFYINGTNWRVVFVKPNSEAIRRTDGSYSVGTTDANTHEIYLNENLHGDFLKKCLFMKYAMRYVYLMKFICR